MIVSHLDRFSIIFTAKRQGFGWQGCARVKPSLGAPEPFASSPTYFGATTVRSEGAAELAVQKEVMALMKQGSDAERAFTSLVADSGLGDDASAFSASSLNAHDGLDEDAR